MQAMIDYDLTHDEPMKIDLGNAMEPMPHKEEIMEMIDYERKSDKPSYFPRDKNGDLIPAILRPELYTESLGQEVNDEFKDMCDIEYDIQDVYKTYAKYHNLQQQQEMMYQQSTRTETHKMIGKFLREQNLDNVLDFGSGKEHRYCQCMKVKYHVDYCNENTSMCDSITGKHRCKGLNMPVMCAEDYTTVVAVNSLQNNSPVEIRSLIRYWKQFVTKMVFIWPIFKNYDESDPYHIMAQELAVTNTGFLSEIVGDSTGIGLRMRYFIWTSNRVYSKLHINALDNNVCQEKPEVSISVHVIGLKNGRMMGSAYKEHRDGKTYVDFLAGGKVQQGETVKEAILREMAEELEPFDFDLKWLGYGTPVHACALVHYYYIDMNVIPKTKENRAPIRPIEIHDVVRDNTLLAMTYLVKIGKLAPDYTSALESAWLSKTGRKATKADSALKKIVEGATPIYRFLKAKSKHTNIHYQSNNFHYVTYRPLKVGEILTIEAPFGNGEPFVFFKGRIHARIQPKTYHIVEVVEIIAQDKDEPVRSKHEGGLFSDGDYNYYIGWKGEWMFREYHPYIPTDQVKRIMTQLGSREIVKDGFPRDAYRLSFKKRVVVIENQWHKKLMLSAEEYRERKGKKQWDHEEVMHFDSIDGKVVDKVGLVVEENDLEKGGGLEI